MARILIVGCGGRGQALARELVAAGHAVRGTTRTEAHFDAIRAAGAEPYLGDPDRIMTLMDSLAGTTILVWLMGSASGPDEQVRELHGGRLRMMCEKIVDTPVRGLIYEAAGTVPDDWLQQGEMIARTARATWNIPLEVLDRDPSDADWVASAVAAVDRILRGD
jgi:nucleoside-diphosphate-sugar epimerase